MIIVACFYIYTFLDFLLISLILMLRPQEYREGDIWSFVHLDRNCSPPTHPRCHCVQLGDKDVCDEYVEPGNGD